MYAFEFETDIRDKSLMLPTEIVNKFSPVQHVRVIMLLDESMPKNTAKAAVVNPLKALLESQLIGCAEANSTLSSNYKAEFSKNLGEKSSAQT